MDSSPFLFVQNLSKSFHGQEVVNSVSLEVAPGELIAIIGPSGCGKSTFLRCLNGLETLDSGSVQVCGSTLDVKMSAQKFQEQCQRVRKQVGMVFQSFNLFPHLTVMQNLMLAPSLLPGFNGDKARERAIAILEKVGLAAKANSMPDKLSGGQQQRAAIARALTLNPKLMLYDEPTSALDPELVAEVLKVMRQLDEEGMTQIVVTHEMRFARDVADRILYMEHGQIIEMGPPQEIFSQPRSENLKRFLRNFL